MFFELDHLDIGAFLPARYEFRNDLWYTFFGGTFPPVVHGTTDERIPWRFKKSASLGVA